MAPSTTDSARPKVSSSSNSRRRVRIVAKIRASNDLETLSSNGSSTPWISVQRRDGDSSDGVTISFGDQTTSHKDSYKLDNCYGQDEDVEQIFLDEVKPLLSGVYNGLNTSIIAYGARGSGKTHLIQGSDGKPGLASLAMAELLSTSEENKISIAISCYEVYQDHIYDLLEAKGQEVAVLEDAGGRIRLKGLSQVLVKSVSEFHKIYHRGCASNKSTVKIPNDAPYRSHKGLMIHVSCNSKPDASSVGQINFLDLAGYEDVKRKSNGGPCLGETAWINKSLYTLQNVVKALNSDERVPYRESKLTRLLQDSLGGKNQTLMITCLNPILCQDTVYAVSLASRSCQVLNQDLVKKTKNAVRPMPLPSPKIGRPQIVPTSSKKSTSSLAYATERKNPGASFASKGSSLSYITERKNRCASSALKGRKLFDGARPIASSTQNSTQGTSMDSSSVIESSQCEEENSLSDGSWVVEPSQCKEENILSDVISGTVSIKVQEEEIQQSTTVKNIETSTAKEDFTSNKEQHNLEATIGTNCHETMIVPNEDHNLEKENNKAFVKENESPPLSTRLRELSNSLKSLSSSAPLSIELLKKNDSLEGQVCEKSLCSLTPLSVEMVQKNDSLKDQIFDDIMEPKTPKCENKIGFISHMEVANSCTPREAYSARSTGIKQSIVQETLILINTASKEELMQINGIGERRANYIMELREESTEPFKDLDDLKGIGLTTKQINGMMRKIAADLFS